MKSWKRVVLICLAVIGGLSQVGAAQALELAFTPQDQNLVLGEDGRIAIVIDEAVELRTIEVEIQFNPDVIEGISGAAGAAFQDLPCYVWEEYDADEAGLWSGFAVSFGVDCYVTGPAELYVWDFTAVGEGLSPITAVVARLYDPNGLEIPAVELASGSVIVGEDLSAVDALPGPVAPVVHVVPNPFNPRASLEFEMPETGPGRLDIYDVKGHRIRCLFDGEIPSGSVSFQWDGCTDAGLAAPSGVYLYRLELPGARCSGRMTLAR